MTAPATEVVVTHWRVVDDETGGISYSISSREEPTRFRAEERARGWLRPGTHLQVWEQRYTVSPSSWTQTLAFVADAEGVERKVVFG